MMIFSTTTVGSTMRDLERVFAGNIDGLAEVHDAGVVPGVLVEVPAQKAFVLPRRRSEYFDDLRRLVVHETATASDGRDRRPRSAR